MKADFIIPCGGRGSRSSLEYNKIFYKIGEITLLETIIKTVKKSGCVNNIILPCSEHDEVAIKSVISTYSDCYLAKAGKTRSESVKNGLELVKSEYVIIHDGARPYLKIETIKACVECLNSYPSAIPIVPVVDSMVKIDKDLISDYLNRDILKRVQTPQGFKTQFLKQAFLQAEHFDFTDEGSLFASYIAPPNIYIGDPENIKLTYPEDLKKQSISTEYRFGCGTDTHRLVKDRKLILGGVEIPHYLGLLGHSDADVLVHSIMDAILSACGLRDIGVYFPDTDPQYKGISSISLLKKVLELSTEKGYKVKNITASIMAEKPKLSGHIPNIASYLATVLDIAKDEISLSATTAEGLGYVGREEGICVMATALMEKNEILK